MQLKYDLDVGALYITLTGQPVARTRDVDDNTSVDLDTAGDVSGIEVVSIKHPWALATILRDYSIPASDVAQLKAYFQPSVLGTTQAAPALSIEPNAPIRVPA